MQIQLLSCLLAKQDDTLEKRIFLNLATRVVIFMLQSFLKKDSETADSEFHRISQFCSDVQTTSIPSGSLILPQCGVPPPAFAQKALCEHLLRLMREGFDEKQIGSVDQLNNLMTINLDPAWPGFMAETTQLLFQLHSRASDCRAMFIRYSLKVLQQRPAYFFPSEQEGIEWRRNFVRNVLELDVEDGIDLTQKWRDHSYWLPFTDQVVAAPFLNNGADVSKIFSVNELQKWLLNFRKNISFHLDVARGDQKLVQHAVRQVTDGIGKGWVVRAFDNRAAEISSFVVTNIDRLFHDLIGWKVTQKVLGPDRVLLKVRKEGGVIEVLCSQFVGSGSSKIVSKVLRLAGPDRLLEGNHRLYAYAKFPELKKSSRGVALAQTVLEGGGQALDPALQEQLEQLRNSLLAAYRETVGVMASEVEIARLVPEALLTWLIRKNKRPDVIKGMGSEYANMGTLYDVVNKSAFTICSQQFLSYAQMLCSMVARMHERKVLHLDLKMSNIFVFSPAPGDIRLKLGDFGVSRKEKPGDMCTWRMSTLCSPGMVDVDKHPAPFSPAMDNWSLGICVLHLAYGKWAVDLMTDDSGKPKESFQVVKNRLEKMSQNNPRVTEIIDGLLEPDPAGRWEAQRAADALSEVLLGFN
jgi:hypothetical protein